MEPQLRTVLLGCGDKILLIEMRQKMDFTYIHCDHQTLWQLVTVTHLCHSPIVSHVFGMRCAGDELVRALARGLWCLCSINRLITALKKKWNDPLVLIFKMSNLRLWSHLFLKHDCNWYIFWGDILDHERRIRRCLLWLALALKVGRQGRQIQTCSYSIFRKLKFLLPFGDGTQ